jgi:hypothetical protein
MTKNPIAKSNLAVTTRNRTINVPCPIHRASRPASTSHLKPGRRAMPRISGVTILVGDTLRVCHNGRDEPTALIYFESQVISALLLAFQSSSLAQSLLCAGHPKRGFPNPRRRSWLRKQHL